MWRGIAPMALLIHEHQLARATPRHRPGDEPAAFADALARDLRTCVAGEVRFDRGSRALYSTDASNYRQVPIGVVIPRHAGDVETTIELARRFDAPILS